MGNNENNENNENNGNENENGNQKSPFNRILVILYRLCIISFTFYLLYMFFYPNQSNESVLEEEEVAEVTAEEESVSDEKPQAVEVPKQAISVKQCEGDFSIVTDTETGVMYLLYDSGYGSSHTAVISVMYNPDGTIRTEKSE